MRMVIAGGGTGGHLFPGIAIAEEFLRRSPDSEVLFVGTARGLEYRVIPQAGYRLELIEIEGMKGKGWKALKAVFKIPQSLLQAGRILKGFRPGIVVGVGGYASGPAVLAAAMMGIPIAITEQNALPGITNRLLGRFADRIFLSFAESARWFPADRVAVTGNPIRAGLRECPRPEGNGRKFTLLVFGGSQGARGINRAMAGALAMLKQSGEELKIVHQTGQADLEWMTGVYRESGIEADVLPFISDMASAYREADLVLCRAGATSIAEITACGKAAVFIPFPHAVNDHQMKNAEVLRSAGAAELLPEKDLQAERLAELIIALIRDPSRIRRMEEKSAALGNPRAAQEVVDGCLELAKK
ncbi:MAG: undecaprenyldiphospho-muramoylpentapeptide beta-N-acetylglucosaminyltransferase [Syntrophales bacterium]